MSSFLNHISEELIPKLMYGISLVALIIVISIGCNTENNVIPEQPILPPTLSNISSFTGSYGEIITIEGDNFGDDSTKVQVIFNKIKAVLKSVTNKKIEAIVPEKNGTSGLIYIYINDTSELLSPREFKYTYANTNPITVLDVDLTKGNAGTGAVEGGIWEDGWKVTSSENQRIVYDCGYDIANGYIEMTFTIDVDPFAGDNKANYFGGYEKSNLHQKQIGGKIYARSGNTGNGFSLIKGYFKAMNVGNAKIVLEEAIGENADWKPDGATLHTVRLSWKKGEISYDGPGGTLSKTFNDFDAIRYAFIGTDKTYNFNIIGQKFKSIKVIDLGRL